MIVQRFSDRSPNNCDADDLASSVMRAVKPQVANRHPMVAVMRPNEASSLFAIDRSKLD